MQLRLSNHKRERYRSSLCIRIVAVTKRACQKIDFQGLLTDFGVDRLQCRRRPAH